MKSSTVIFSCIFVIALALLPYTSNAAPLLASENAAPQNKFNYRPSQEEGGQFQFAQYASYQQQNQRLQKKWSRLEPSIRFFKRSQPQQQIRAQELANRFMLL